MLQATLSTLEKELQEYKKRVEFLNNYTVLLRTNEYESELDRFEALDLAYKLQKELNFKTTLIEQRKDQIEKAKKQEELKQECIKEFPDLVENASIVLDNMYQDVIKFQNIKKRNKQQNDFLKGLKAQHEQTDTMLNGIASRFNDNPNHPQLINDFRQLHEIIKLVK